MENKTWVHEFFDPAISHDVSDAELEEAVLALLGDE